MEFCVCVCVCVCVCRAGAVMAQCGHRRPVRVWAHSHTTHQALDHDRRPQVARGLRYMHMARPMVIHRDLKLENILIGSEPGGRAGWGSRAAGPGAERGRRLFRGRLASQNARVFTCTHNTRAPI